MRFGKKNDPNTIVLERKHMSDDAWEEMNKTIRSIAEKHLGIARRVPHSKAATLRHLNEIAKGGEQ